MKHLFVTYVIAKLLKDKGFDELCFGWWCWVNGNFAQYYEYKISNSQLIELNNHPNNCSAPIHQQVVDWFRDKHSIWIKVEMMYYDGVFYNYTIIQGNGNVTKCDESSYEYYEALNKAIEEALKLIK